MPLIPVPTQKQMRAAGRELRRRREGKTKQQPRGRESRPFGAADVSTVRAYASYPEPQDQRTAARIELMRRRMGDTSDKNRPLRNAWASTLKFYASASDDELRRYWRRCTTTTKVR